MGAGKTYHGQLLSNKLSYQFIDLDHYIEQREQQSIYEIFLNKGEKYFRFIENKYLTELLDSHQLSNFVLSVGGGTPCFYNNMRLINNSCSIYLRTSIETLYKRLLLSKYTRPLLKHLSDIELKEYIIATLTTREPFYATAKIIVNEYDMIDELYTSLIKKITDL